MFLMCDVMVFTAESCFLDANQMSTRSLSPPSTTANSSDACRKFRVSVQRGPLTVTIRESTSTVTPVALAAFRSMKEVVQMVFILQLE